MKNVIEEYGDTVLSAIESMEEYCNKSVEFTAEALFDYLPRLVEQTSIIVSPRQLAQILPKMPFLERRMRDMVWCYKKRRDYKGGVLGTMFDIKADIDKICEETGKDEETVTVKCLEIVKGGKTEYDEVLKELRKAL